MTARRRLQTRLADEPVVLRMRPDPPPEHAVINVHAERPIVIADTHRPEATDCLEMERRVTRIRFQTLELLVR